MIGGRAMTGQLDRAPDVESSVLDHRFGSTRAVHARRRGGVHAARSARPGTSCSTSTRCSRRSADGEFEARVNAELMQSVIEITTPVCRTPAEVDAAAAPAARATSPRSRAADGCRFASAGTHPFSLFERQRITAKDRYRKLVDQMQYIARRELIFGMHVHAAVDDPDKAIQVVNGLLIHLPEFLALSASSPFWRGEPTGLASSRQMVFSAFPRSGVPPRFESYEDVRRARRPARAHRLHRRLHAHLVGHPAASAARHGRAADLRRGHAGRGRGRARRLLPGAREDALRARRVGRDAAELPPDPDDREQVARRPPRARGAR